MATFLKSTDCHGLRGTRTKIRRKTTAQAGRLLGTWIQQALHGRPEPVHHLGAGLEGPQQDRSAYDLDLWCPLARLFCTGHYQISHQNRCEIAMNSRKTQKRTSEDEPQIAKIKFAEIMLLLIQRCNSLQKNFGQSYHECS